MGGSQREMKSEKETKRHEGRMTEITKNREKIYREREKERKKDGKKKESKIYRSKQTYKDRKKKGKKER